MHAIEEVSRASVVKGDKHGATAMPHKRWHLRMASDQQAAKSKPDRRRHRRAADERYDRYGYTRLDGGYKGKADDDGLGIEQRGDEELTDAERALAAHRDRHP